MKRFIILGAVLFSVSCVLLSCGKKKALAKANDETTVAMNPPLEIQEITIDEGFVPPRENAMFQVEAMEMKHSELHLRVVYSGGCEEHLFNLYFNGNYAKSYPPQVSLFLEHIDNNDRCRAMITKELVFDVSGIEYPGTSELKIRLNNTDRTLQYKY